jgi:hypothetical protein
MTVEERPPRLQDAARLAGRAVTARWRHRSPLPRLKAGERGTAPPTVWMICPDWDRPAGGTRKQYRVVDVLNAAGLDAAIVHTRPGFSCSWFAHTTKVVAAPDVIVGEHDLIVVPELYGPAIRELPAGVRQVIFNQNPYMTLDSLVAGGPLAEAPYADNPDLAAMVVVSADSAELLAYAFPDVAVRRIRLGIDPAIHHPPAEPAARRIAYMPRKRVEEQKEVLRLLELRGVLDDWELVPIWRRPEAETAELLRSSSIFLSFGVREGFGLPPCEAMASGCLVVGFDGFGGREYFRLPYAESVENGDTVAFARAVERLTGRFDDDPAATAALSEAASRFVLESYSPAAEAQSIVDAFAPLLQP